MYFLPTALDMHNPVVQAKLGKADILVFQRNVIFEGVWDAMSYWRALGKVVIVDLDDHYPAIPPSNPAHPYWILNANELDPPPIERLRKGLEKADALIAPSQVILKDWEKVVKGYMWPNYPAIKDYETLQRRPLYAPDIVLSYGKEHTRGNTDEERELVVEDRPDSEGKIIIGWGGSISHIDSFFYSGVLEAMKRLMDEDERVMFKFCGWETRLDFMLEQLPEDRLWRQTGVSPYDWPQVLSTIDIGIAPMDMRLVSDNTGAGNEGYSYDERRSWLKCVEYLCAGIPFVATDCASYDEMKRFGKFVDNRPGSDAAENWYQALKSRVDGIEHFRNEAYERRGWALKRYTQEANADKLIELYLKIGEDAQMRQGLKMPNVTYVEPNDAGEPVDFEILYEGDPLEVGHAEWNSEASRIASTWYNGLALEEDGLELGHILEYPLVDKINKLFARANEPEVSVLLESKNETTGAQENAMQDTGVGQEEQPIGGV